MSLIGFNLIFHAMFGMASPPVGFVAEAGSRIIDGLIWLIGKLSEFVMALIDVFVTGVFREILFFPPPSELSGEVGVFAELMDKGIILFFAILGVVSVMFFLMSQLFPENRKAGYDRFFRRVLVAIFLLLIVYVPEPNAFDLAIEAVNVIGQYLYPQQYTLAVVGSDVSNIIAGFSTGLTIVLPMVIGPGVLLTAVMFLAMLSMRMLIIYTVYALFPILIAFWIVDIGPPVYLKMVGGFAFKASAFLLLLGILMAAVMGVSGAVVNDTPSPTVATDGGYEIDEPGYITGEKIPTGVQSTGVYATENRAAAQTADAYNSMSPMYKILFWFAGIWINITVVSMILGVTTSTGFTARAATARSINKRFGKSGAAKKVRDKAPNVGGDRSIKEGMSNAADKATGGAITRGKQTVENTKQKARDINEDVKDTADEWGDKFADKSAEVGKSAGETVGSVAGETGAAVGSAAGEAGGRVVGAAGNATITYGGKIPEKTKETMEKSGDLAKRGAKGWWNAAKTPAGAQSVGKVWGMARRSKIGQTTPEEVEMNKGELTGDELGGMLSDEDDSVDLDDMEGDLEEIKWDSAEGEEWKFNEEAVDTYNKTNRETGEEVEAKMQKGTLTNSETGESFNSISFDTEGQGQRLEEGASYQFENAGFKEWHSDKPHSHDGTSGRYNQIQLRSDTEVSKTTEKTPSDVDAGGKSAKYGDKKGYDASGAKSEKTLGEVPLGNQKKDFGDMEPIRRDE